MRDARSSTDAHVWVGGDGRIHRESERPPLSVFGGLLIEAVDTVERRSLSETSELASVAGLVAFLGRHLVWWAAQEDVGEFAGRLDQLVSQLRPVTGEPRPRPFARCPNPIDLGDEIERMCGGPLFPPVSLFAGVIACGGCGRGWEKDEWGLLGSTAARSA